MAMCALVCKHVPACACVCLRERGRVSEDAGVCAQMYLYVLSLCLCAPLSSVSLAVGHTHSLLWPTRPSLAGLTCAHAHWCLCRVLPASLQRG